MEIRSESVRLALCAMLIGTASAWAAAPHKAPGLEIARSAAHASDHLNSNESDKGGEGIGHSSAPPPIVVQVLSPQKTEAEATENRKETDRKADVDRQMVKLTAKVAKYTEWLAYATIALVIFTAGLFLFAFFQSKDTREAVRAATRSAETAATALQGAETPYLIPIVRTFDPAADPAPLGDAEGLMSYTFQNCGRSPALVLEIYHSLIGASGMPNPTHFPPLQTNLFKTEIISPGRENDPERFTVGSVRDWTPSDQTTAACLIGSVRYADVFGNQFVSNFCYFRNGFSSKWYALGTPAHNARRQLVGKDLAIANARDTIPGHIGSEV